MIKSLYIMRKITKKGYTIRGFARLCEIIRKYYSRKSKWVWVQDFDANLKIKVDLSEHMGSQIFWRGFYSESQLIVLSQLLTRDAVFFDIGANIGEFTLFAAKRLPQGKVYAFEPVLTNFRNLYTNITQNNFSHVYPQNIALSDMEGETKIFIPTAKFIDKTIHSGLPSLFVRSDSEKSEVISLTTLDKFVENNMVDQIDLMKIDVEGSELPILRGGKTTLQRFHPKIIIEINKETCSMGGYEPQDILGFLRSLGYTFQCIGHKGVLSEFNEDNISEFQNILCINAGRY